MEPSPRQSQRDNHGGDEMKFFEWAILTVFGLVCLLAGITTLAVFVKLLLFLIASF